MSLSRSTRNRHQGKMAIIDHVRRTLACDVMIFDFSDWILKTARSVHHTVIMDSPPGIAPNAPEPLRARAADPLCTAVHENHNAARTGIRGEWRAKAAPYLRWSLADAYDRSSA